MVIVAAQVGEVPASGGVTKGSAGVVGAAAHTLAMPVGAAWTQVKVVQHRGAHLEVWHRVP